MKTTVQKSALVTALLLLTACAGGPGGSSISLGIGGFGSHIGLGTSVNIPIGNYLVQDFYGDGQKRTDPMILPKKALFSADAHPTDSAYTVYDRNGNPIRRQVYRNNRLIGN